MRLMALLVVLLVGTFYVNAPPAPVPVNCAVGPYTSQRTAPGTSLRWTRPGHRPQGHAHNDYEHGHPLTDALAAGFRSVEADVWAVDGELLVAHTRDEADRSRTLAGLYLDPLVEHFARDRRRPSAPGLQLLIDVKSASADTLPLLRALLPRYARILTRYRGCTATPGPVSVVVSGNERPASPAAETVSYFGYDMQPERTQDTGLNEAITPLVSGQWDAYFTWGGHGSMPSGERARLDEMVRAAHAVGSAIRFYGTPDDRGVARDAVWRELVAADVDYISTDDLAGFRSFIRGVDRSRADPRATAG